LTDRRTLIAGAAAVAAGAGAEAIPGTLDGTSLARGHRLRRGDFPAPSREERTRVAIIGGGVAGLSAAWTLAEAGVTDWTLLELEDRAGGNARSGRNAVSAYPLGAHYLPIPNPEAKGVLRLLERLGVVTGWEGGKPVFDPYQVVADPDERLLHLGRWQEGLVPTRGLTAADRRDLDAFFAVMASFRDRVGRDGRPAFALPMELSSRDPDLLALDRLRFTDWLHTQGWRSPMLHAHVRYGCRDDYGTEPEHVSAWAGIHYWAGRRGAAANCDGDAVLTWPEGNGYLTGRMAQRLRAQIAPARIAFRVTATGDGVTIDSFDVATKATIRTHAEAAVLATPRFVTARLLGEGSPDIAYAPWLVANITVDRLPAGPGAPLAWDNVSWTSPSLGYVVAGHQSLASTPGPTVLTWYYPLSDEAPAGARRRLLSTPLEDWQRMVRDDLLRTNPDLEGAIRRIDIWRWGHAMIRPVPGLFWSGRREAAARARPPLFFAHADLSGLSLFEEANYRGVKAAEDAMAMLGVSYRSVLT
jgi:glycine/D-amino acid oxidase-like deaminating enzyme